jgi:hypothetical protein
VLIFGRTYPQGKNLAQCGLYGLATGDLPLAFVFEQTAAVALVVGHPPLTSWSVMMMPSIEKGLSLRVRVDLGGFCSAGVATSFARSGEATAGSSAAWM